MSATRLSFQETGYFPQLICDYLEEKTALQPFYNRFPKLDSFGEQIKEKASFPLKNRQLLAAVLRNQYQNLTASEKTLQHLTKITEETTFTITTGHQLNLFTGPLYFLYKIITTLRLAEQLQETYPACHFVPVYWMATEDHDAAEINHFYYKGKKIQWNVAPGGATGELKTEGLETVLQAFEKEAGGGKQVAYLKELFAKAYLQHAHLADATRYLVNELFGRYGLVILDANVRELKQLFIPYVQDELQNETAYKQVNATVERLQEVNSSYPIQVNPRNCNLFYLNGTLRERIVREQNGFRVNGTEHTFTGEALLKEVDSHPERFSPNVLMRPLYQEVILPNLCYIGGAGELAYWLELKAYFEASGVPFPMLLLRHSALLFTQKQAAKLEKLHISPGELFLSQAHLINRKIKEISAIPIDFTSQKLHLQLQFKALYRLAQQTDASFLGAVRAQEAKQLKGLDRLEERLLKAQKRKETDYVNRIATLHNELFPNGGLQERAVNFSEFYAAYSAIFTDKLFDEMKAFESSFLIVTLP